MKKAALCARVIMSSDAQLKEGTIESQVVELRRQIATAGHVLVKEYIDDGYSGTLLDRAALNQVRADLKAGIDFVFLRFPCSAWLVASIDRRLRTLRTITESRSTVVRRSDWGVGDSGAG